MTPEQRLLHGVQTLDLDLTRDARAALMAYVGLLSHWNRAINLTAVREPHQIVTRHLLDSLTVLPFLQGREILDIGSGAGLPGIPLAIINPERRFTLLDSHLKKISFLRQVVHDLGLNNVVVTHQRAEKFQSPIKFDTLVARAFAKLADLLSACGHLLGRDNALVAMKGQLRPGEVGAISTDYEMRASHAVQVPGLNAMRHIAIIVAKSRDKS
jgi:16S rRNA (guanine527-N7)-methyltransferase